MATDWRYLAYRVVGDGTEVLLDGELPLADVKLTGVLSGPPQLTATIPVPYLRLIGPDRLPVLGGRDTAVYAEADGIIRGGWLLAAPTQTEDAQTVTGYGFSSYAAGQPYPGEYAGVQVDPADVVRLIWAQLQAQPGGNLGLVVEDTTTPVRVGTPERDVSFTAGAGTAAEEQVSFPAGPYRLDWWSTDDCGKAIDDLAAGAPFDYTEHHEWNLDRTQVLHRLRLTYPRIGRRRSDLRFVVGENVPAMPDWGGGDGPVNEVRVLGAGEGRDMVHATAAVIDGRLRRVAQISDRDITSTAAAADRAHRELAARRGLLGVRSIAVRDHSAAPIGSWSVGDEIRLQGEGVWGDVDSWFRIVGSTIAPTSGQAAVLDVIRSEASQ